MFSYKNDSPIDFIRLALSVNALKFGEFETKSGRISPYFFNMGFFNNGFSIRTLGSFYASALIKSNIEFDMLFGPAYKGIPLVISTSTALSFSSNSYKDIPFAFNRKESKDHGEKGSLIGAQLRGKIAILDDVITSGMSIHESIEIIRSEGADPAVIVIALDRMEKSNYSSTYSAAKEISNLYNIPVISIASLKDIFELVQNDKHFIEYRERIKEYRMSYGL
ncbi:orotate phosphoribosyltransferase [Candidatus Kinetoplastibacterium desouzaii TCC079E]|uniref:Orotate phosphoribosyltransferase n=1 Tax=Candidatus Kinetoplastidibacterium desouzai TCC079E TaxID=1208919 RepID=M1LVD8_9PROT|nr:orotate phosphoribosyltransferase [Candidatus Kinetoplastibacterium desouzaii]AGF47219.1 orotate phosphoribosyltransferase [Candidatus Kinetoplastibacterium desouzaii TCC079E]